ncbi:MAG: TonB-dependent SusC/RagA subfamily outer membrane receptor, partial [Cyclobacteriaceae bacterium]
MENKLLLLYRKIVMYSFYGLTIQLFLCTMVLATDVSVAQKNVSVKETYASLDFKSTNLISIFSKIEQSTNYTFTYDRREINKVVKISGSYNNATVYEILMDLSKKADLGFKQFNNNIIVSKLSEMKRGKVIEIRADVNISGKITDENGEGLPGASIVVKGTTVGATTNLDGNYKLSVPEGSIVTITYVGYLTKDIEVGSQSVIDVQMELDAAQLEEIVVIGYGTQKKADLTGSLSSISGEGLDKMQIGDPSQLLLGRMAGVRIESAGGSPGASTNIVVRGVSSLTNSDPLFVIDGMFTDNMDFLNPSDIKSIQVLKDASAAAIYGSRAAAGVVIVTTRNGDGVDGIRVDFETSIGTQSQIKKLDWLSGAEYAELRNTLTIANTPAGQQPDLLPGFNSELDPSVSTIIDDIAISSA